MTSTPFLLIVIFAGWIETVMHSKRSFPSKYTTSHHILIKFRVKRTLDGCNSLQDCIIFLPSTMIAKGAVFFLIELVPLISLARAKRMERII